MANKQVVVRTAQDLERKYNLAALLGMGKNIEINKATMQKLENELIQFVASTTGDIEQLKTQVDGKVTTWYYTGEPTLTNKPAIDWNTDNLRSEHIGDLYYDKATGYTYVFQYETEYGWIEIKDQDVTESLAIANAAKDTADSKRQVFVVEPTTPYDVGDLWIKDNEIFICQVTRKEGNFNSNDWINSLKYTDDTVAEAVGEDLKVLEGTVTTITKNYVKFTDLSTGGSTTIAGENITTGNIESKNYVENTSGTKISLEDGTIDTKNFKVDEEGNVTMESATITNGVIESPNLKVDVVGDMTAYDAVFNNVNIRGGNITLEDDGTAEGSSIKIKTIQEYGELLAVGTDLSSQKLLFTIDENTIFPQPTDLPGTTITDGYQGVVNLVETSGGYKVRLLAIAQRVNIGSMINYTISILKDNTKIETIYSRRLIDGEIVNESLYFKEYELSDDTGNVTTLYDSTVTGNILLSQSIARTTNYHGYGIEADIISDFEFTEEDITKVQQYILNQGTLSDVELVKYDVNKDGQVNSLDLAKIGKYVRYNVTNEKNGKFIIDTKSIDKNILILDGDGNERVSMGIDGIQIDDEPVMVGGKISIPIEGLPSGSTYECYEFKGLNMVWCSIYLTGKTLTANTRTVIGTASTSAPARRIALAVDATQDGGGVVKASITSSGEISVLSSVAKESSDDIYISGWWTIYTPNPK